MSKAERLRVVATHPGAERLAPTGVERRSNPHASVCLHSVSVGSEQAVFISLRSLLSACPPDKQQPRTLVLSPKSGAYSSFATSAYAKKYRLPCPNKISGLKADYYSEVPVIFQYSSFDLCYLDVDAIY